MALEESDLLPQEKKKFRNALTCADQDILNSTFNKKTLMVIRSNKQVNYLKLFNRIKPNIGRSL